MRQRLIRLLVATTVTIGLMIAGVAVGATPAYAGDCIGPACGTVKNNTGRAIWVYDNYCGQWPCGNAYLLQHGQQSKSGVDIDAFWPYDCYIDATTNTFFNWTAAPWAAAKIGTLDYVVLNVARCPGVAGNTPLNPIVCGGAKYGAGWHTYPYGGYDGTSDGNSCRSQIDYIATPTGGAVSAYYFGQADGRAYTFQAWIPTEAASANMDFTLFVCGRRVANTTVNQYWVWGWVTLFTASAWTAGCESAPQRVYVVAWSGVASSGYSMGLDAVRSHT